MKPEKQIKQVFLMKAPEPDPERRRQAVAAASQAASQRYGFPPVPFARRLLEQCRYLSPLLLLGQAALVLALFFYFSRISKEHARSIVLPILSAAVPLLGIFSMPELCKSYFCSMWELEQTCRYNLRQLMTIRLLLLGLIDLCVLLPLTLLASRYSGKPLFACALYLLVPFFACCLVYLSLFRLLRREKSTYVIGGAGVAMAAIVAFVSFWGVGEGYFYTGRTLSAWVLCLAVFSAASAWMLYLNFYRTTKKEELYQWN